MKKIIPNQKIKKKIKQNPKKESNLVLQHTYEYRQPTAQQVAEAAAAAAAAATAGSRESKDKIKLDMTSRYLGLVVVPGRHIVRIEVEEFASQMRGRRLQVQRPGQG